MVFSIQVKAIQYSENELIFGTVYDLIVSYCLIIK